MEVIPQGVAFVLTVTTLAVLGASPGKSDKDISEYCQWEKFNATCGNDEIIIMTHAQYGRMRLGRCLTTDVYIGCGANVLNQMDTKCSGKQSCQLQLPDSSLHQQQPCPNDMMAYLEASYTCVKVSTLPEGQKCSSSFDSNPTTNLTGVLSSTVARATGYGMQGCPWTVGVKQGQNIRVTLLDFGLASRYKSETWNMLNEDQEYCYVYAVILDRKNVNDVKEFTVCAGKEREQTVYVSTSNVIDVVILDGEESSQNFLLKYEAVGCPDLIPPLNAFALRQGEGATITCNTTTQAWHLVCKDTEWIGEYGECTAGAAAPPPNDENVMPSYGLILAILIGVAIGVMVGFTLLAGVLYCRRRRHDKRETELEADPNYRAASLPLTVSTPGTPSCKIHRLKGEYGYTHVWEVQPSPGGTNVRRPMGTRTPDSAYQSYQSQRGGTVVGDTMVCFHPKKEHDYESPKFETFGVGVAREGMFQRPVYQGCAKTCTMKPHHKNTQYGDSLDSVVHIEVGLDSSAVRGPGGGVGQPSTGYSMAGDTKAPADSQGTTVLDNGADAKGNHYT